MRFLFTCAGTAGHINPALAIAGELKKILPGSEFLFVGAGREMENRLIPAEGYAIENISVSGFARGFSPSQIRQNVRAVKNLMTAGRQTEKILREFEPDVVMGTGGYVCYPVLKKAAALGIPTAIHESNAEPGLTTKTLSGLVTRVFTAFPGTEAHYNDPARVVVTGTPVRTGFQTYDRASARRALGLDDRPLVVSFWGSLGAARMNEAMLELIRKNLEAGTFRHIHATGGGEENLALFKEQLAAAGVSEPYPKILDLRAYIDDMPRVMAAADLILCRAGASTIAELILMEKPSILVPSPYVTANHQEQNARRLSEIGGAALLLEKDCTGGSLYDAVSGLVSDPVRLAGMRGALSALNTPNPAEKIAELIISLC